MDNAKILTTFINAMELMKKGELEQSLALLLDIVKKMDGNEWPEYCARIHMNIGLMKSSLGLYRNAIENFSISIDFFQKSQNLHGLALVQGNIGSSYRDIDDFSQATFHYHESLNLHTHLKDLNGIADQKANLAYIHALQGNYDQSLQYFVDAKQDYHDLGLKEKEQDAIVNIDRINGIVREAENEGT